MNSASSVLSVPSVLKSRLPDTNGVDTDSDLSNLKSEISDSPATVRRRWTVPLDHVGRATANLPDEQRNLLRWIARHGFDRDLSLDDLAANLKKPNREPYSRDSLYQAITGRRSSDLSQFCNAIRDFRDYIEREQSVIKTGFIETDLTKKIFRICRKAFERHKVAFIFSESQVGKTRALEEYARTHNHGETVYVRMPTRGSLGAFVEALAVALGISPNQRLRDIRWRILNSFDDRMLLIVDEAHQGLRDPNKVAGTDALEFAREIHDRRKCGLVICGTNTLRTAVTGKERSAGILRQLWLRRGFPALELPDVPTDAQLATFAAAFKLPPAPQKKVCAVDPDSDKRFEANPYEVQSGVIATDGLGQWITTLQEAADIAADRKKPLNWGHVLIAFAQFQGMKTL